MRMKSSAQDFDPEKACRVTTVRVMLVISTVLNTKQIDVMDSTLFTVL